MCSARRKRSFRITPRFRQCARAYSIAWVELRKQSRPPSELRRSLTKRIRRTLWCIPNECSEAQMTAPRLLSVFVSLFFSGLGLLASDGFQKLANCVEQKDMACVVACLKDAPADGSPEYFALAARAYMLLGQNQEAVKSIAQAIQLK